VHRVEKSQRLLGQLLMIPVAVASNLASYLRLLVPEGEELFLGLVITRPTGYKKQETLFKMQNLAYTCQFSKKAGLQKT